MITVAIVDDHPIVRDGIRSILETQSDLRVLASVAHDRDIPSDDAMILVLDWELAGGEGGVPTIERLRKRLPHARILVFSAYAQADRVRAALAAGAAGYVLKGSPADELISAIRSIAEGGSYLGSGISRPGHRFDRLTTRELEVLRHVARGLSNHEIAEALHVTERTVKFHLSSVFARLSAKRRSQAIAIAKERGLL